MGFHNFLVFSNHYIQIVSHLSYRLFRQHFPGFVLSILLTNRFKFSRSTGWCRRHDLLDGLISAGCPHLAVKILNYLDSQSLLAASLVTCNSFYMKNIFVRLTVKGFSQKYLKKIVAKKSEALFLNFHAKTKIKLEYNNCEYIILPYGHNCWK